MNAADYTYVFEFVDGRTVKFTVNAAVGPKPIEHPPEWAQLSHRQCPNCPLELATTEYCPAALSLVEVIETFESVDSTAVVKTTVISARRQVFLETDVQTSLRSLMGLIMPTSGCPILGRLRGLASFHLPFSDRDETVYRVVASYLLEQYLISRDGGEPDWELNGIRDLYDDLQRVDVAFAERMRTAASGDASVNALVALFSLAALVSMSVEEDLSLIRERMLG